MTAQFIPVEPFDLVVFGGTGDLAMRKLLPGLYHRDSDGQLTPESRIIGAARSDLTCEAYLVHVEADIAQRIGVPAYRDPQSVTLPRLVEMPFIDQPPTWRLPDGRKPARAQ